MALTLSGTAFAVPYAHVADRVLVPAATDGGVVVAWWTRGRRRVGRAARPPTARSIPTSTSTG